MYRGCPISDTPLSCALFIINILRFWHDFGMECVELLATSDELQATSYELRVMSYEFLFGFEVNFVLFTCEMMSGYLTGLITRETLSKINFLN